ncbi:putative RNA-binding protein Luc7-like 1 isoform X6 [Bolinopsis microptera]|uniref:putative RNA-binding protein Luc7-like 1 isoform X6 n=1 Tax=Bolinopsis microptera TaxID=2820187 RepID=UPI003078B4B6
MTAQEQMRKMLDQLMGSGRDGNPESAGVHFTDPTVCRAFMTGLCPHTLFTNTKMDLGECPKVHSEALRADFDEANKKKNYGFEKEALALLDDFLRTCDRKVEAAKKRLEDQELDPESESRANKVHDIAEQIGQKLAKAEQLGNEGNVDESVALLTEIEKLKSEKRQAEEEYRNNLPQPQLQQQKLRVCEICAAYLCLYDNDRRLADHFGGKLHMGFIQIREKRNVLEKLVDDKSLQQEGTMDRETFTAKSNDYNRQPSRGSNYNNGRSRREYSYRRQRSRSRSSDRSRRNRSRSPRRRSKSRDRRSRSRDRRSRDRRSRSRSGRRSRSPRRRSRDRKRYSSSRSSSSSSSSASGSSASSRSRSRSRARSRSR